ncbi:NADP-dependent oxidoreductase [soil metagenome]
MPRAVVATAYTGAEGIGVIDVESTAPAAGQVTIAVRSAALNPWDLKQAKGAMGTDPAKLPMRLGGEAAGVITAVGTDPIGVEGEALQVGDAVFGHRLSGAQASELTVKAAELLRKPESLTYDEAAGLLTTGTTAWHGLDVIGLGADVAGAGQTLLIHGVSGGVGALAAQLAILRGARVIGTAGLGRHEALRSAGIVPVAYGDGLLDRVREAAPEGVSAAFDTVGTDEALTVSLAAVSDAARIVTIANFGPTMEAGGKAIGAAPGADRGSEIRASARVELSRLAAQGAVTVSIAETFTLDEAADAYALIADGHAGGKIVLNP